MGDAHEDRRLPVGDGHLGITWVVYESSIGVGTFTKVFERTTSDSGAATFISSGAMTVPLAAGKSHIVGVIVQGAFTQYQNSGSTQAFVSFGQAVNSVDIAATTAPSSVYFGGYSYWGRPRSRDAARCRHCARNSALL